MTSISAPQNPKNKFRALASKLIVLLGENDGTPPALDNEVDYLIPNRIGVYANGGRDDVLAFDVDMKKMGARLQDTAVPIGYHRQIEVRTLDDEGEPKTILAWGFIARQPQTIDDQREEVSMEARLDQHVFGVPLTGWPIYTRHIPEDEPVNHILTIQRPLIFNPEIDEIIEPNRSDAVRERGDMESDDDDTIIEPWHYFIDPESMRTQIAKDYEDQEADLWTLSEAVHVLCWWLNPDEEHIKNPHLEELQDVFKQRDDLVKNIEIPFGSFLPAALDLLLLPAEFGWHLVHSLNDDDERETRMRFYPRGKGVSKQVHMQRIGQQINFADTNVTEFNATYSIVDLANRIEVYGDYIKVESTFPLQMAWDQDDDHIDSADLEVGQPLAADKPFVFRKWVLGEGADCGDGPDGNGRRDNSSIYFFFDVFGENLSVKRRRFEKCLSQHSTAEDKESNRFRVDFYDDGVDGAVSSDDKDDPGWTKVQTPFSVLEKECGIIFEGSTVPGALWEIIQDDPTKAKVRITATVASDTRIKGVAERREVSPNGMDLVLVLDMKKKFQKSKVHEDSIFHGKPSIARDDTTAIAQYAEEVRDIEDAAQISCSVILEGIDHHEYQLGDLIDKIDGRNLSLNGYATAREPRRPQIVGFNYLVAGGQRLELLLDAFKQERPDTSHAKPKTGGT